MKTKILQVVFGGILATLAMTMIVFVAPYMGLPKMNPSAMLSVMMGVPILVGWGMHLMIGIVFALTWLFLFIPLLRKITSRVVKGIIFGMVVFAFAQIMMQVMNTMFDGMSSPDGNMLLLILGGLIGHIVYGVVVALLVRN